jgi:hypothetical protein
MSLSHSPQIVTDGLVLCLDAANQRSYPKSGTTWSDLKGSNNGTLTNGPTFDSANKGSIVFDGVNDYVTAGTTNLNLTNLSICCWVKFSSKSGSWLTMSNKETSNTSRNWYIGLDSSQKRFSFLRSVSGFDRVLYSTISPDLDRWYYYCGTSDTTVRFSIYVDGDLNVSNTYSGSLSTAGTSVSIGKYATQNIYYMNGNVSNLTIYNRALTADEVLQNYLATRGRYK